MHHLSHISIPPWAAAPFNRSDELDTGRNGPPALLQDRNSVSDDQQASPPGQPASSELSLQDSVPSSPSLELVSGTRVNIQPGLSTSMSNTAQKGGGKSKEPQEQGKNEKDIGQVNFVA